MKRTVSVSTYWLLCSRLAPGTAHADLSRRAIGVLRATPSTSWSTRKGPPPRDRCPREATTGARAQRTLSRAFAFCQAATAKERGTATSDRRHADNRQKDCQPRDGRRRLGLGLPLRQSIARCPRKAKACGRRKAGPSKGMAAARRAMCISPEDSGPVPASVLTIQRVDASHCATLTGRNAVRSLARGGIGRERGRIKCLYRPSPTSVTDGLSTRDCGIQTKT